MKNFRDRLGRELLLMDGAMGTMLQSRGLKLGELPGSMNLRAPEVVRSIHAEYAAAGQRAHRIDHGGDYAGSQTQGQQS